MNDDKEQTEINGNAMASGFPVNPLVINFYEVIYE